MWALDLSLLVREVLGPLMHICLHCLDTYYTSGSKIPAAPLQ